MCAEWYCVFPAVYEDFWITPACAGKTPAETLICHLPPDHPRMRGEDGSHDPGSCCVPGSPPHARGRHGPGVPMRRGRRITPACAGKTGCYLLQRSYHWDHPRMRGEDWCGGNSECSEEGSPPHARGRQSRRVREVAWERITPACAGKTRAALRQLARGGDHPRMRGEDLSIIFHGNLVKGSPPHARGRLPYQEIVVNPERITPACAGKTRAGLEKGNKMSDHPRMRGED